MPHFRTWNDTVFHADSFDFTAERGETQVALLLPAVQSAREAARRKQSDDEEMSPVDDFAMTPEDDGIALPPPAVEADLAPPSVDDFAEPAGIDPTPFTLVELLVV